MHLHHIYCFWTGYIYIYILKCKTSNNLKSSFLNVFLPHSTILPFKKEEKQTFFTWKSTWKQIFFLSILLSYEKAIFYYLSRRQKLSFPDEITLTYLFISSSEETIIFRNYYPLMMIPSFFIILNKLSCNITQLVIKSKFLPYENHKTPNCTTPETNNRLPYINSPKSRALSLWLWLGIRVGIQNT